MSTTNWQDQFNQEIDRAETARLAGKEGMARVYARRAAGIAIGEYFHRRGLHAKTESAYDRLNYLSSIPGLPPKAYEAISHLTMRVNTDHQLPKDVDLITETKFLYGILLSKDA